MDHEPQWESLVGSQNSLKNPSIEDDNERTQNDTDDLLVSLNNPASLANLAPMSSISEVTLDKFPLK